MAERYSNSQNYSIARGRLRLPGRLASLGKMVRVCQNRACLQRRVVWPDWLRKDDGVCLQGQWYCSSGCFELAAQAVFRRLLPSPEPARRRPHRIPIGLFLLSRGTINNEQLKLALDLQKEKGGGRIGKFLRQIQAASEQDITDGLAAQWGCPVYPLGQARDFLKCASLLPLTLLETGRMLPVHHLRSAQMLYIGFVEGIDHSALYAVEQMLRLRTVPCVVAESELLEALNSLRHSESEPATVFDSPASPVEMARITRSYARQVNATDVWIARSGRFIWSRLQSALEPKDILFQALGDVS
ncbi:MAG: hypothetical protein LAO19_09075 [Acidobacteriia bacterium]|nr:hypothetical protein [Terriglobia bacterium]